MATAPEQTFTAGEPSSPALHRVAEQIGEIDAIDPIAEQISEKVRELLPPGPLKDALSGTWLGHALHPLLTDVPIGTWTSAGILDLIGGRDAEKAAERLIGVGLAAALPTIVTGYSDWADTTLMSDHVKRIGLVHAASNAAATTLYAASYLARRRGHHGRGVALGLAAAGALGFGGFLGGHLSYQEGVGVDQTIFEEMPTEWTAAAADSDVVEGKAHRAEVDGVAIMLTRHQGRLCAIADRCTHRGGPLSDGELENGCVTCPWHHSVFRVTDGSVERGPATSPQPAFDVRVRDGQVEVRLGTSTSQ